MEKTEWQALEKKQRDAFLRMSDEKSRRIQELEAEKNRFAQEVDRRQKLIEEAAFKGPKTEPLPEPIPEFQDMGQLVGYVEEKVTKRAEALFNQRMQTYEQKKVYEDRWVSAWNTVSENDKTAHLFRDLVRNELMNRESPYLRGYNGTETGSSEVEIIQKTVDGIRNIYQKYTDAEKQKTIQDMRRKTSTGTEKPGKSISVGKNPKDMSKSEIIADLNAELGPIS